MITSSQLAGNISRPWSAATLGVILTIARPLAGQESTIPEGAACTGCSVGISGPVRSLALPMDFAGVTGWFVEQVPAGQMILGAGRQGAPLLFASNGTFQRALGGKGAGPGDFQSATAFAVGPGDSIAVFDPSGSRLSLLTPDGRFTRSIQLPQQVRHRGFLWLGGDPTFVIAGLRPTIASAGFLLHLYRGDGTYESSVGDLREPLTPQNSATKNQRLLTALPNGHIMAVSLAGSYDIEEWEIPSGKLIRRWHRDAPWFAQREAPLETRVSGIRLLAPGLLVVAIHAPNPHWRDGVEERQLIEGAQRETTYRITDRNKVLDTVLEVIDLDRSRALTRLRLDSPYVILRSGLLAHEVDDAAGTKITLHDIQLQLKGR